jgi:hypothetical protein
VLGDGHQGVELARVEIHDPGTPFFALAERSQNPGQQEVRSCE